MNTENSFSNFGIHHIMMKVGRGKKISQIIRPEPIRIGNIIEELSIKPREVVKLLEFLRFGKKG